MVCGRWKGTSCCVHWNVTKLRLAKVVSKNRNVSFKLASKKQIFPPLPLTKRDLLKKNPWSSICIFVFSSPTSRSTSSNGILILCFTGWPSKSRFSDCLSLHMNQAGPIVEKLNDNLDALLRSRSKCPTSNAQNRMILEEVDLEAKGRDLYL